MKNRGWSVPLQSVFGASRSDSSSNTGSQKLPKQTGAGRSSDGLLILGVLEIAALGFGFWIVRGVLVFWNGVA